MTIHAPYVEPQAGELLSLSAHYTAQADAEEKLASNLDSEWPEAAGNNRNRAHRHRRTAGILAWLASFEDRGRS